MAGFLTETMWLYRLVFWLYLYMVKSEYEVTLETDWPITVKYQMRSRMIGLTDEQLLLS